MASESGVAGVVGVEGGVTFWRERQWKREKKVGVEGEDTGVVGVEREGEEAICGEMESFIVGVGVERGKFRGFMVVRGEGLLPETGCNEKKGFNF